MALVSVIMPAYNAAATLQSAVRSLQKQTFTDWELLLIVDVKTSDITHDLAHHLSAQDSRIRLITGLEKGGCVFNRNHGFKEAQGDFICLLDSDDLWHPQKLEKQLAFTEAEKADITCTGYGWMNWDGSPLSTVVMPLNHITHADMLLENHIGCLTVMLRRARYPHLEFVDFLHEDYILWLQLTRESTARGLRENLATYRLARHSRSGNKIHAATKRWQILRRFEKLSLPRSLWCFGHYAVGAMRKRSA